MTEKQSRDIQEEVKRKATHGKAVVNAGAARETYQANSYTPAGDRITPYEADEDLGEKGNIRE